jgi:subtilase family serine protease
MPRHALVLASILACCLSGCGTQNTATMDLAFASGVTYSPSSPSPGQAVTVTFSVFNGDTTGATATNVAWRVARDNVDGFASGSIASIPAGTSVTQTFSVQESSGTHSYAVIIDPDDAIAESNEDNNVQVITITWGGVAPPPGVDLYFPVAATTTPSSPSGGTTYTLAFTVGNQSGDASTATNIGWSLTRDGVPGYRSGTIPSLGPNTSTVVSIDLTDPTGSHTYELILDPGNTITESNETNNTQSVGVAVMIAAHG